MEEKSHCDWQDFSFTPVGRVVEMTTNNKKNQAGAWFFNMDCGLNPSPQPSPARGEGEFGLFLQLGGYFGGEVFFFLLDAFTEFEADEAF